MEPEHENGSPALSGIPPSTLPSKKQPKRIIKLAVFYHPPNGDPVRKNLHCTDTQNICMLISSLREMLSVASTDSLFLYVQKRHIPELNMTLRGVADKFGGGDELVIDVATAAMF